MHPELLLAAAELLSQSNDVFRGHVLHWRIGSIRHKATTGQEAAMDEFVSLFEKSACLVEHVRKTGKVARLQFADKLLRMGELATDLPLALRVVKSLRRREYAEKFIDLALCIGGIDCQEPEWSDKIAFESSVHAW